MKEFEILFQTQWISKEFLNRIMTRSDSDQKQVSKTERVI
jgi:hypothetical protein